MRRKNPWWPFLFLLVLTASHRSRAFHRFRPSFYHRIVSKNIGTYIFGFFSRLADSQKNIFLKISKFPDSSPTQNYRLYSYYSMIKNLKITGKYKFQTTQKPEFNLANQRNFSKFSPNKTTKSPKHLDTQTDSASRFFSQLESKIDESSFGGFRKFKQLKPSQKPTSSIKARRTKLPKFKNLDHRFLRILSGFQPPEKEPSLDKDDWDSVVSETCSSVSPSILRDPDSVAPQNLSYTMAVNPDVTPTRLPTLSPTEIPIGNPTVGQVANPTVTPTVLPTIHATPLLATTPPTALSISAPVFVSLLSTENPTSSTLISTKRLGPPPSIPYDPDAIFGGDSDEDPYDYSDDEGDLDVDHDPGPYSPRPLSHDNHNSCFGNDLSGPPTSPRPPSLLARPTLEGLLHWQTEQDALWPVTLPSPSGIPIQIFPLAPPSPPLWALLAFDAPPSKTNLIPSENPSSGLTSQSSLDSPADLSNSLADEVPASSSIDYTWESYSIPSYDLNCSEAAGCSCEPHRNPSVDFSAIPSTDSPSDFFLENTAAPLSSSSHPSILSPILILAHNHTTPPSFPPLSDMSYSYDISPPLVFKISSFKLSTRPTSYLNCPLFGPRIKAPPWFHIKHPYSSRPLPVLDFSLSEKVQTRTRQHNPPRISARQHHLRVSTRLTSAQRPSPTSNLKPRWLPFSAARRRLLLRRRDCPLGGLRSCSVSSGSKRRHTSDKIVPLIDKTNPQIYTNILNHEISKNSKNNMFTPMISPTTPNTFYWEVIAG